MLLKFPLLELNEINIFYKQFHEILAIIRKIVVDE